MFPLLAAVPLLVLLGITGWFVVRASSSLRFKSGWLRAVELKRVAEARRLTYGSGPTVANGPQTFDLKGSVDGVAIAVDIRLIHEPFDEVVTRLTAGSGAGTPIRIVATSRRGVYDPLEPPRILFGDPRFDRAFGVDPVHRAEDETVLRALLDETIRAALMRLECERFTYDNGEVTVTWRGAPTAAAVIDDAIDVVVAACRFRAPGALYR